ncbi:LOW QUALITY PROTEIN: lachrymatory-factor synthase-like [Mangifera indica]|uniref:LOW QUALITY PROTEIN: lachrymatory-factor synthase-like n=1 Tax=Mangifera indica TaxID=29780 RepID=UPI001CFA9B25|nr:LOW QUALITY PROTEIN: lachrymatory-factor synthase-like [Mangifera indica]
MAEAKWEGKVNVEIASLTVEQVWACLEDYCNLHKWFPFLDKCYRVEGVPGKPGLVRHVKASPEADEMINGWAQEKLLMIDPIQKSFSYEVTDNNSGFNNYVATIKVFPVDADDQQKGCIVEWSFATDPVPGWTIEKLLPNLNYCLQYMGKKMEQTFL